MRPTLDFVQQRFNHFNAMCFEGQLPMVKLRISTARTYLGQLQYQRKRNLFGFTRVTDLTLSISKHYDRPERDIEDTIIHEMIHLYILVNKLRDTSAHGPVFRSIMDSINHRFNRQITISHKRSEEELSQDTSKHRHYLCVSTLRDGQKGVTLTTATHIFALWRGIASFEQVVDYQWYVTSDPWFNRYRRSRTIKIYAADPAELQHHLADAQPLVKEGSRIFVKRDEH